MNIPTRALHDSFDQIVDDVVELGRRERRMAELLLAFVSGLLVAALIVLLVFGSSPAHAGTQEDIASEMAHSNWQHADAKLEKVLAKHPDHALAHYWLAQVRMKEGQAVSARDHLATAKALDPSGKFVSRPDVLRDLEVELALAFAPTSFQPDPSPALTAAEDAPSSSTAPLMVAQAQQSNDATPVNIDLASSEGFVGIGFYVVVFATMAILIVVVVRKMGRKSKAEEEHTSAVDTTPQVRIRSGLLESDRDQIEERIRRRVRAYSTPSPDPRAAAVYNTTNVSNTIVDSDDGGFVAGVVMGQMMSSSRRTAAVEETRTAAPAQETQVTRFADVDTGGSNTVATDTSSVDTGGSGASMD